MGLEMISIGNKVEVVKSSLLSNGLADENEHALVSVIYDIIDNEHLQIEMPLKGTQYILLETNIRYQLCIYTPHGLFKCTALVTDRFKKENRYIAQVAIKSAFKRVQRREYFRLEKLLEIEYRNMTKEEAELKTTEEILAAEPITTVYTAAVALDLSGGGARMVMNEKYEPDDMIMVHLKIGGDSTMNFVSKVVLSTQMKMDKTQYENRVKFIKVKERDRENLIRYIFEEERKMRSREKG